VAPSKVKEAVDHLLLGNYTVEKRSMVRLTTTPKLFEGENFALNEFAIHKKDIASMIKIKAFINGELLNSYYADGLVVATPTGSTGYSISCGGPIILPESPAFVITPVAPHNLNVRPVVVPDNSVLSFEVEGMGDQFLVSLDSRTANIDSHVKIEINRNPFDFLLVRLNDSTHLRTLRSKLLWGIDKRN
jgi:NAD+ kinase